MTALTREQVIQSAPPEAYTVAERAFHGFWYSHMLGDLMQPPLCGIDNATAAYIYAAARAQALDEAAALVGPELQTGAGKSLARAIQALKGKQ